ncbi:hypothetical protein PFISCL1PPCAC_22959, partial [Pristionchus fissidentatus]
FQLVFSVMSRLKDYENLLGGLSGGVLSTLVCHPMDLLKIRYSANDRGTFRPQYTSYFDAARQITRAQGVGGLYQGLSPNLIGCAVSWGAYLHVYDWMRERVRSTFPTAATSSSHLTNFACAYFSGSFVMCFTNPIWLVKTRLCLQYESGTKRYEGMTDCMKKIVREEGVRGLYKGFVAGLLGASHGATQMMIYTHLKERRARQLGLERTAQLPLADYFFFSTLSKVLAVTLTYPYQVVRTRMQDHNAAYSGVWNTLKRTVAGEGVAGLYKGLLMANIRTLPSTVIVFVTYEKVKHAVRSMN